VEIDCHFLIFLVAQFCARPLYLLCGSITSMWYYVLLLPAQNQSSRDPESSDMTEEYSFQAGSIIARPCPQITRPTFMVGFVLDLTYYTNM